MKKLILVVPCFNEVEVLPETTKLLSSLLDSLINEEKIDRESRILYVNDGSHDGTWDLIEKYSEVNNYVCGLSLAHNCGHQNALIAGLTFAKDIGDMIITIDADLQDDIKVIPEMVAKYDKGAEIVYGIRKERKTDTFFKRSTAMFFYHFMEYCGAGVINNHADFRLMSKRAVESLLLFKERNLFLRGIVPLIGYKTDVVYYDRLERLAGETKYPFSKMFNFAIDGITSFSVKPVRMVFLLGVLFIVISLAILVYVLYSWLSVSVVPGWSSIILSIWFVGGAVMMGLGIVGEYIGKIYVEVKERPRFIIDKVLLH